MINKQAKRVSTGEGSIEPRVFWILSAACTISVLAYVIFINFTVINIVAKKNAIEGIRNTEIALSEMEQGYLDFSRELDEGVLLSQGFEIRESVSYTSGIAASGAFSLNENN